MRARRRNRFRLMFESSTFTVTSSKNLSTGWRNRATFQAGMERYLPRQSHAYILVGLVMVVAFSRMFGSGDFLQQVMGDDYKLQYRTFIQEGLELAGYILLAWGALRYRVDSQAPGTPPVIGEIPGSGEEQAGSAS